MKRDVSAALRRCMVPALIAAAVALPARPLYAQRMSFDADWRFQNGDPAGVNGKLDYSKVKSWITATGSEFTKPGTAADSRPGGNPGGDVSYAQPGFDDSGWRRLNLPHDWGIEGPFRQQLPADSGRRAWWGIGWYRKHFSVTPEEQSTRFFLDVDGAMSHAMVWVNGRFAGGWPYGFASWELDMTPYVQQGDNVIAIRLDNPGDSSRWYPGGGIYRNVWLVAKSPAHMAHWGVCVTTPKVDPASAEVQVRVHVQNASNADASVVTKIYEPDADGHPAGPPLAASAPVSIPPSTDSTIQEAPLRVSNPKLWSLEKPNLYVAVTSIVQDNRIFDVCISPFGIRTIKFDPNHGFFLNGEHVKLNGVCNHADLGALGSVVNVRGLQRQIELLKEMGCNAIRTSHNPPAPELLDLCDRMGMLVMDEFSDCWKAGKKPNGYNTLYDDWHEKDLRALVRRDRNHPSVILWSIGNEIPEQSWPAGAVMAAGLSAIVHEEDPTRPTTFACSDTAGGYNGYQNGVDVFGYNYKPWEYAKFHSVHPSIPLFGSETASTISSRGEYFFPVGVNKDSGKSDFQVSSYDLNACPWSTLPDSEFKAQDQNPEVAGEFVWTGFDYLGEPTPYGGDSTTLLNYHNDADKAKAALELKTLGKIKVPSRSSYFGILDLAGFEKDRFYLYQAHWRPDFPMAHILPHWNWPDRIGQVTPVYVYTSGDEAELFLNGKSLGRKKKGPYEYRIHWDEVVYEPGELKVIAYKNGQQWAEDVMKTTGPAAKLLVQADRARIMADGQDLSYVTVTIADKDGLMVPRSKNLVQFDVSGPADIVAVDNGDATSLEPFQAKQVAAFNGLALVILRGHPGEPGNVVLHVRSDGLVSADLPLQTQ